MLPGLVGSSCVSGSRRSNLSPEEEPLAFEGGPASEAFAAGSFMIDLLLTFASKESFLELFVDDLF